MKILVPSHFAGRDGERCVCVCIYISIHLFTSLRKPFPRTFQVHQMYSKHLGKAERCGAVTLNLDYPLRSPGRLLKHPNPGNQTQPGIRTTGLMQHAWTLALADIGSNPSPDTYKWHDSE